MAPAARIGSGTGRIIGRCASVLAGLLFATTAATAASVTLAWDPVAHPLLSGYAVYVGPAPGDYVARQLAGDATTHEFTGLDEGRTYHFAVTAYDVFYSESVYSNDVVATVPYRAPAADFSASTTIGTAPLALNFTAAVQGTVTSYAWDFGDGGAAASPNPVHVYETPGSYSVTLAVAGPGGRAVVAKSRYVTVFPAAAGAGMLAGALLPSPAIVDLTAAGTIDWVKWPGDQRKRGVAPQISTLALVGRGAVASPGVGWGALQWSDGAPAIAGSSNEGVSVSGTGRGLSVTAPADPTTRTLTLVVGATNASGRLVARLSDNSAPEFVSVPVRKLGTRWGGVYTLTYRAASAGQTIRVEWTQARGIAAPGRARASPGVGIQGAALAAGP